MKNLEVLSREQVAPETQEVFDALKGKIGMVPNLYAVYANSHQALTATLALDETLKKGEFNAKEVETIALAIAEANSCDYCLAAHTAIGKMVGLSEEETAEVRNGEIGDEKLFALAALATEITVTRGKPEQQLIENFLNAGYSKGALVELIGFVAQNTFNNYLNHIAGTAVDFPAPPVLAN